MKTTFDKNEISDIYRITLVTILILFAIGVLSGCTDKCEIDRQYTYFKPVFQTTEEVRAAVAVSTPQQVNQPGKIYFKDGYLFINEVGKGIHVVDNKDPRFPRQVAFVNIPGNFDIAAKGNYLYADSFIDLLVFDISDVSNIEMVNRVEGAFDNFSNLPFIFDASGGILTSYEETEVEEIIEEDCGSANIYYMESSPNLMRLDGASASYVATSSNSAPAVTTGTGGSMARFTIYEDYLYTIDVSSLYLFDISTLDQPVAGEKIDVGWGIETLFPYGDKLFIGANNGMHIYDNAVPEAPVHLSTYAHVLSCDPVVVEGDYAFVTLRSGNNCGGVNNQLDVVDISDLRNPTLFKSYPMQHPHGLGVDGKCLFVCEGEFGLKLFDKTNLSTIDQNLVAHYTNMHAFDLIPMGGVLMMIGEDGLYQYEYDCEGKLELLSTIQVLAL